MLSPKTVSFSELQAHLRLIYIHNGRFFQTYEMMLQLSRFALRIPKRVRKHNIRSLRNNLAITLAWTMALADRYGIDIGYRLLKEFPDHCPYCVSKPCRCKRKKPAKRTKTRVNPQKLPTTIQGCQKMFREIYSRNNLQTSTLHGVEEIGEIHEAFLNHTTLQNSVSIRIQEKMEGRIREELTDLVTHLLAIAACAKIDLAGAVVSLYKKGCHVCGKNPCKCTLRNIADGELQFS